MLITWDVLRYCAKPVIDWRFSISANHPKVETGRASANDGSKTAYLTYYSMLIVPITQEGKMGSSTSKLIP